MQAFDVLCVQKVLVNIDRIVRELDNTTCDVREWAGKLSNSCKCCLFKKVPQIGTGPGQKTAEEVVNNCISEDFCREDLDLVKFLKESADLKTALYQLYNTSVVIKKIEKEGISFDSKGDLTEQGVKTFLEKAYREGKLPYEDFKSVACTKVQDIFAQKKGFQTAQLFLITSNCDSKPSSYILKEMKQKYSEVKNLAKFFEFKKLDDLIWPNHIKNYPSLAIPFAFFQYNDHYLSLAPTASGRELDSFILDYFLSPTQENRKRVEQAYFDIGYALSKFHQRFRKNQNDILGLTIVHGDLHHKNIFYDAATHQVILIDNEDIPFSFENLQSPIEDIAFLILSPGWSDILIPQEIRSKVKPTSLIELIAVPALKGYISAYQKKDWSVLFNRLVEGIKENKHRGINMYNKFKDVIDKQFEIVKLFVQNGQSELKNSLIKLQNSLVVLNKLLLF